jgi:hypothetical protein
MMKETESHLKPFGMGQIPKNENSSQVSLFGENSDVQIAEPCSAL